MARLATAAGIGAWLAFGVVFTAEASPAPSTEPGLELLEDATDALGLGDAAAYDALVDEALRGDVGFRQPPSMRCSTATWNRSCCGRR